MRIGNQFDRANELRIDRPEQAVSSQKIARNTSKSNFAGVRSDIEVLRDNMTRLEEDRSELLATIKDRVASGKYFTHETAIEVAEAIAEILGES